MSSRVGARLATLMSIADLTVAATTDGDGTEVL